MTHYHTCWTSFSLAFELSNTDKLLKFIVGRYCVPLVAGLFLFCYESDFIMSLSDDRQAGSTEDFNLTSRYVDDILNCNNLSKANFTDTEAALLDLHLLTSIDFVSSKCYDKRDDVDFDIVNFPGFSYADVPSAHSYCVYISQLSRFARVNTHLADFNALNKTLTAKLLQTWYQYHKLRKAFS